jgi:aspartyl-tRNA(Asn)/glutamyl-tRNA(Gln) amidotransferase subunit A
MTFQEWRQLSPQRAAQEVHARVRARLSPAQQRAVIAWLPAEPELEKQFAASRAGAPLHGVPYFAKDLFDVAGVPTLAGSTFLPEVRPPGTKDGAFVRALREAGAVLAGKTHTHEFAYGVTGENPNYGDAEHPHFPGRTTGGSSSGSVAAVAAGLVPLALGSDTGGSVRVPAAFCGLYGYRLTPDDAWIRDGVPLSPSFDTAGWFTANAADMRASIAALVGLTPATREPRGCYLEMPGVDDDVAQACRDAALRYTSPADPDAREQLTRGFAGVVDTYHTTVAREAWRFHEGWAARFRERYDPVVWQRLNRVHDLTPAQLTAAEAGITAVRITWAHFFARHDFLIMPASPAPAFTKAECTLANRSRVIALTAPASVGGLPALTIPVPLPSGLTTGLQIIVNDVRSPVIGWALERS